MSNVLRPVSMQAHHATIRRRSLLELKTRSRPLSLISAITNTRPQNHTLTRFDLHEQGFRATSPSLAQPRRKPANFTIKKCPNCWGNYPTGTHKTRSRPLLPVSAITNTRPQNQTLTRCSSLAALLLTLSLHVFSSFIYQTPSTRVEDKARSFLRMPPLPATLVRNGNRLNSVTGGSAEFCDRWLG